MKMKNIIIISILTFFFALNLQADENRTPVKINHNSHKMGNDYKSTSYTTYTRYQKIYNYQGQIFDLEYRNESSDYYGTIIQSNYIRVRNYDTLKNEFNTLYTPDSQSDNPYIFSEKTHAVFFGYADYLWFFGKGASLNIYRFNINNNQMDIIETPLPFTDNDYCYSASCVMDTCIYAFRSNHKDIMVDVFNFDESTELLVCTSSFQLEDNSGNSTVASAESFLDSDGILKIVYTTISGSHGEAKRYNPETGSRISFFSKEDLNDIKIAFGSMRGDGESNVYNAGSATEGNPNRCSVFFVKNDEEKHKGEIYNKRCPIGFVQFAYDSDGFVRLTEDECRLVLSSDDYYAKSSGDAIIDITYNYVGKDMSNYIKGREAHQKQIVLVNCDKKQETNFSYFDSDIYMIKPGSDSPVSDFSNEEYEGVREYWTLVGITEGAPPAPVDWEVWDSLHASTIEPSELELEYSSEGLISVESSTENSYGSGFSFEGEVKIHIIPKLELTGGYSSKHSQTNESVNKMDSSFTYTISQSVGLNETSQENAYYFYLAPTISRYHYQMYPWWDVSGDNPILGVDDYMFKVIANTLLPETYPLTDGIHQVSDPNDENMEDWIERGDANTPNTMASYAHSNDLAPAKLSWKASQGESSQKLSTQTSTVQKQEYSYDNEVEYSFGLKIPHIFEFTGENFSSYNFSIGTEVESTLDKSINIKYETGNSDLGFMCDKLVLDTYLFTPSSNYDWWYYDSLPNGFKPWYIAYGISTVSKYDLQLLSPASDQQFIDGQSQIFSWQGEVSNVKVYILNAPDIRPENIIKKTEVGKASEMLLNELPVGKYYWAIRATDPDGIIIWTKSRPFEILQKDFFKDVQSTSSLANMAINVYPNPASSDETKLTFELEKEGEVFIQLYNLQGQLLWRKEVNCNITGIFTETIPLTDLSGTGVIIIKTPNSRGIQKIVKY